MAFLSVGGTHFLLLLTVSTVGSISLSLVSFTLSQTAKKLVCNRNLFVFIPPPPPVCNIGSIRILRIPDLSLEVSSDFKRDLVQSGGYWA